MKPGVHFPGDGPVESLRPDVPRTAVQPDLRDSLGSLLTVYELRRNNAAARISALVEDGVDPGGPDVDVSTVVFGSTQELLDAAAARENGDPIVLAVRSLLQLWGAQRRGSAVVEQIQRDLAATGLTTRPPFTDGGINGTVAIVPLDVDPDETEPETVAEESGLPPVSYLVGNLASATSDVMSAQADEALGQAIVRMRENNFSQLPVLSPDGTLKGALTWQSIAAIVHQGVAQTRVADAITHASTAYASDSLLSKVKDIGHYGYVFVIDESTHVTGIVTSADLAGQFADRVQPFILVEEVEQRLRRIVDGALADGRLALATMREVLGDKKEKLQAAKDLTLGQYRPLFEVPDVWAALGLEVSHELFIRWAFAANEFRNNLMHFSPDPLAPGELATVQGFLNLLKALDSTP